MCSYVAAISTDVSRFVTAFIVLSQRPRAGQGSSHVHSLASNLLAQIGRKHFKALRTSITRVIYGCERDGNRKNLGKSHFFRIIFEKC
jgi:hypothetical protein